MFPLRSLLLFVIGLSCAGCDLIDSGAMPAEPGPTPVTVFEVPSERDHGLDRYSASLAPYSLVKVRSQVDGQIVAIPSRPGADGSPRELQGGDRVVTGDELVRVDEQVYREKVARSEAEVADQEASMVAAKDQYDRYVEAGDAVAAGQTENMKAMWESSQTRVARATHGLEIARIDLARCKVTAPSDGLLLSRAVEVGDVASKGTLLFELADVTRMKVVFEVPAALAAGLADGSLLEFDVSALDGRQYTGPVTRISPSADPRSRLFEVELTVINQDGALKVGMIASLHLADDAADEFPALVPIDAVVRPPGETDAFAVYVLAAGSEPVSGQATVSMRTVELGEVLGAQVVVTKGLAPGDLVVVRGSTIVDEGATVRVIP